MLFEENHIIDFISLFDKNQVNEIKDLINKNNSLVNIKQNYPIGLACEHGNLDLVKFILNFPEVNPSDYNNYAFSQAAGNGYIKILKILLSDKRLDLDNNYESIEFAYTNKHYDIVDFLFEIDILKNNLKKYNLNLYDKINTTFRKKKILKIYKK